MKKYIFGALLLVACSKPNVYKPVGGFLEPKDMEISKNRAKELNQFERKQIEQWIAEQNEAFFPANLNYWINIKDFKDRKATPEGTSISYSYDLYDFVPSKIYENSFIKNKQVIGKSNDLNAVMDAVKYLKTGEEATLLVPSTLAFGTYGDGERIQNDVPLIIKLKMK